MQRFQLMVLIACCVFAFSYIHYPKVKEYHDSTTHTVTNTFPKNHHGIESKNDENDSNEYRGGTINIEKSTNDTLEPIRYPPPLVIGAGYGTTGTHTLLCATCLLGLPSVHWKRDCSFCDHGTYKTNIALNHTYDKDPNHRYVLWPQENNDPLSAFAKHPHKMLEQTMRFLYSCRNSTKRKRNPCHNNSLLNDI